MMENIKRITITDFHRMETAARQAVENIPDGHCRIKEEVYNRKLLNLFPKSNLPIIDLPIAVVKNSISSFE